MRLIICEKPSVARKLADAVSHATGKKIVAKGAAVKHFEIGDVVIASAVGHLYTLVQEEKKSGYPVFDVKWVPAFEVNASSAFTKKYWSALKTLALKADSVVNACDYDLEGSLIGWNIARFLAKGKPVERMKFSYLTRAALEKAFHGAEKLDLNNSLAGEARHKLDWIYGINLSRALMSALKTSGTFRIMSIGRVQGPALSIIASREQEISVFKPETYWQVYAFKEFEGGKAEFVHEKEKFWNKKEADKAFAGSSKKGIVEKVSRKKVKQTPPVPYDLTTLQVDAYRNFGYQPARTLKIAQSLYEGALISYPRTSSQKLPAELGLDNVIRALAEIPDYAKLARKLIDAKRFTPNEGKKEDQAHPAVFPTGEKPGRLSKEEKNLYDLIAKRFLACFAKEATKEKLSVSLMLGSERFKASGSTVVDPGWLEFFGEYVKHEETRLPDLKEGEAVKVDELKMLEKETTPPKRFTPASVVKELEKHDLGTKATRSQVIQTLFDRGYVAGEKSIQATPFGLAVYKALSEECPEITGEELTRTVEKEIEAIQEGKKSGDAVFALGKKDLKKILSEFKKKEPAIGVKLRAGLANARREASVLGPCKCGGNLILRKSRYGVFVGCDKYPACKQTYPLPRGASIQPESKSCGKCGTPVIKVLRKGKRPFTMCLDPKCETKADWGKPKNPQPAKE